MKYRINGTVFQSVLIELDADECVYSEPGRLLWMSQNVKIDTSLHGGMVSLLKRKVSGEKFMLTKFAAKKGGGKVMLAGDTPGEIMAFNISRGNEIVCERNAFIASTAGVDISPHIVKYAGFSMVAKKKMVFQELKGEGTAFISVAGEQSTIQLKKDEVIYADPFSIVAFNKSIDLNIMITPGIKNVLFAEIGVFLARLRGPGMVHIQNVPFRSFEQFYRTERKKK